MGGAGNVSASTLRACVGGKIEGLILSPRKKVPFLFDHQSLLIL